jgi:hypothetical protein
MAVSSYPRKIGIQECSVKYIIALEGEVRVGGGHSLDFSPSLRPALPDAPEHAIMSSSPDELM